MEFKFEYVHRCWIYAQGTSPYTIDAYAKQQGVSYDKGTNLLRMVFPSRDAALGCVAENRDFEILRNQPQITFMEFIARTEPVRGKDIMGQDDYIIPEYRGGDAIAFIKQQANSITPLQLVAPGNITKNNQVAVHEGGLFEASPNLNGKKITIRRLPIIYPEIIHALHKQLPATKIFMVITDETGKFKLCTINTPEIKPTQQANPSEVIIQATINPDKVEYRTFS